VEQGEVVFGFALLLSMRRRAALRRRYGAINRA
jgi:hypothetical protein